MLRVNQVKLHIKEDIQALPREVAKLLHIREEDICNLTVVKRSLDARKKPVLHYAYSVDVVLKNEGPVLKRFANRPNVVALSEKVEYQFPTLGKAMTKHPVVIIGTGPAGLFCGYFLSQHGYCPILLERGKDVDARQKNVDSFWSNGQLHPESNVQFGEGGAGTFSDGKLNTLVKDKSGRNKAVLNTFIQFGAPLEIAIDSKPHIGTDILCNIVKNMRQEIISKGGQVRFDSKVTDIVIENDKVKAVIVNGKDRIDSEHVVLAIGHSARDTFEMLSEKSISMKAKEFAVGLRVEHPQALINASQYGVESVEGLGAAPYKLAAKTGSGRGVYSFCMCPGGYVVNASSEPGHMVVNGMSYSARAGKCANSAIVVTVNPDDFPEKGPLAGVAFQRALERKAFELGKGKIPVQFYGNFKSQVESGENQNSDENISYLPQTKGQYTWANVNEILPEECNRALVEGMEQFGRQIQGFNDSKVCLMGVESRTSSPVRILRDDSFESNIKGLYPCGEGAGYAGGIMSAAMDGMKVAEAIACKIKPFKDNA